jgi:hypothetical protein
VIAALLYLQYHSIVNRLMQRFRRLKQPKYLFGGIVGAAYFYFYFLRHFVTGAGRSRAGLAAVSSEHLAFLESLGALLLFTLVFFAWLIPHQRATLAFTETEIAFLFPAPISRRGLIHFKLLRSQAGILFTTFFLVLVSNRFGGKAWAHAAGWWLILSIFNLHLLGSSFARTMLLDRGISNTRRRLAVLALVLLAIGSVAVWAWRSLPRLDGFSPDNPPTTQQFLASVQDHFQHVMISGPLPYLLYPCRLVVRPYLAPDGMTFLLAAVPALLLLALHYWWVVRSNVAFEEASVEAARRLADKVTAIRSGNWRAAGGKVKIRRPPFSLQPIGPPAVALLWKNLISAGQVFTLRLWILLLIVGGSFGFAFSHVASSSGLPTLLGMLASMLMVWLLLLGPQILRQDLRQDLPLADVLKAFPLRGWEVALGELLAPAVILTAIHWFLLLVAVIFFVQTPVPGLGATGILGLGVGAALVLPMLNLILLQIPNAAVLMFPAWFQTGKDGAQGIEATGQRLISMFGQVLVFIVTLIPAGVGFGIVFLITAKPLHFPLWLTIPLASSAAAVVLAIEAALGMILLGTLFERFDVSAELTP